LAKPGEKDEKDRDLRMKNLVIRSALRVGPWRIEESMNLIILHKASLAFDHPGRMLKQ
jgi:hypothetical protein